MFKVFRKWSEHYLADEEAIGLLVIIASVLLLVIYASQVMAPVIASLIISYLLLGVVQRLSKKMPTVLAFYFSFGLFVSACIALMLFVVPLIVKQLTALAIELPNIFNKLQSQLEIYHYQYPELLSDEHIGTVMKLVTGKAAIMGESLVSISVSSLPNVFAIMVYGVLIPLLVFFFVRDKLIIQTWFVGFLPKERPMMNRVWLEMNQQVANYVRGKAIEVLVVGIATLAVFLMFGLNYAALLAFGVGLSVIVPYVGAVAITVPVVLVAFWQFGISDTFMMVIGAYLFVQFLDGNVLVPLLFSEAVNMHPVAIILSVLFFGGIWGLWGVFFAIPLATLIKALLAAWPRGLDYKALQHQSEAPLASDK